MSLIKNKRGGTLTNWVMIIATALLFLVILQSQVLDGKYGMNNLYNQSHQTGLDTSGLDSLTSLKNSSHSTIEGAEAEATSDGLSLKDAWTVGKATYSTIAGIVSGNFLYTVLVDILNFPKIVADVLIIMIWMSLIMIIIYIFMKVVP